MVQESYIEYQKKTLIKEIEMIQQKISNYDNLSFKIKGWCITLWSAIITLGLQINFHGIYFIIFSASICLIFWFVDTFYKIYQRFSIVRMEDIQDFLNSLNYYKKKGLKESFGKESLGDFLIFDLIGRLSRRQKVEYDKYLRKKKNFWKCFLVRNIWVIYCSLILTGVYIGLVKENLDQILFIISYPIICLPVIIIVYIILGKIGFHD